MINRSRRILTLFCVAAVLATPCAAQYPDSSQAPTLPSYSAKKKEPQGPRAVAVMEWTTKGPRLIPVAIKINDQFYDAGLYLAQPVPMALDSGNVYEVQRAGESLGDFTVGSAAQTPNGLWIGLGSFDSKAAQEKRREAAAKRVQTEAKQKAEEEKEEEGSRPVLKRPAPKSSAPDTSTPPAETKPTTAPSTIQSAPAPPPLRETVNDPNRPILRRGKPAEEQATSLQMETDTTPKKAVPPPAGVAKLDVAISDATPKQQHSYVWTWANPDEEKKLKDQVEKLALATLNEYASRTNGPKPGALQHVQIHTYDLNYSNAPTVILSARVEPEAPKPTPTRRGAKPAAPAAPPSMTPAFEYYVTVVGREDIYGQLQKKLAVATDNKHLDAFPKMELVDAVDVDGNGNGDLLFQSTSDRSDSFVIYQDRGYNLEEVIRVPGPKV